MQGRSLTVQPDCLKGRVACGHVYGHALKDLPHLYLEPHGLRYRKSTIMD